MECSHVWVARMPYYCVKCHLLFGERNGPVEEICPSQTSSFQEMDMIPCGLKLGHIGFHRTLGTFPSKWD